jgi:hypothetical protein
MVDGAEASSLTTISTIFCQSRCSHSFRGFATAFVVARFV